MKFSKESLKYKKAIEELSQFKFGGTVYFIDNPAVLFEHLKKVIVNIAHGAGCYEFLLTILRDSDNNNIQCIFDEAKNERNVVVFYIPLSGIEFIQIGNKLESKFVNLEPETQSIYIKSNLIKCALPTL